MCLERLFYLFASGLVSNGPGLKESPVNDVIITKEPPV